MTPQEQQLLGDLTQKINQTVLPDKDPEAEQFLISSLSHNPDAVYILAQTVLVQNYALTQAQQQLKDQQQQIAQLKQAPAAAQAPEKHGSFLGNLLGMQEQQPAPPPLPAQTYPPTPQAQYAPVNAPMQSYPPSDYGAQAAYGQAQYGQPYGQAVYGQPQYGQSQQGSFLRSAMQTAAGVAAGAMLFEGAESLLGGFEHHAGYGGRGFEGQGGGREEIVNNYYGDSAGEEHGRSEGKHFGDNLTDTDPSDIEDRRDDNASRSFADTDDSGTDQTTRADDSSYDDSSNDDSSNDEDDNS